MVLQGPLVAGALTLFTSAVYLYVGNVVHGRVLTGEDKRANDLFALWWYSLAAIAAVGAGFGFFDAFGYTSLVYSIVLLQVALLVICLALWGLGYYLAYLFTGKRSWYTILAAFYTFYWILLIYAVAKANPIGVKQGVWQAEIQYEHPLGNDPVIQILLLFIALPQVVGAIAYFTLYFRVPYPMQRYRIALVAGSLVFWFGSGMVAGITHVSQHSWWTPISQLIAVTAALVILIAYQPPAWIERRLTAHEAQEAPR